MLKLYRDFEHVKDFKTMKEAAEYLGCGRINIYHKKYKADGLYKWKDFLLLNEEKERAKALMMVLKLEYLVLVCPNTRLALRSVNSAINNIHNKIID